MGKQWENKIVKSTSGYMWVYLCYLVSTPQSAFVCVDTPQGFGIPRVHVNVKQINRGQWECLVTDAPLCYSELKVFILLMTRHRWLSHFHVLLSSSLRQPGDRREHKRKLKSSICGAMSFHFLYIKVSFSSRPPWCLTRHKGHRVIFGNTWLMLEIAEQLSPAFVSAWLCY